MPRRNNRHEGTAAPPLDLTPTEVNSVARSNPLRPGQQPDHNRPRRSRAETERENSERQARARMKAGIDWSVCLVPGCGEALVISGRLMHRNEANRTPSVALPLCYSHLSVAYLQANRRANEALMVKAVTLAIERRQEHEQETAKANRKAWLERTAGDIYFVRLNGLVKVGWSRDVHERLRAYGPLADVLCIYPGSRDDETNLHRQLRPVLARGREWYEDCKIIADFVAQAIEKHGPPVTYDEWTKPKQIIRPRKRAS